MTDSLDTHDWPSAQAVILPSRAFLLSWRDQTLPTRTTAIEDAVALFEGLGADSSVGLRDMSLLGVVAEAMQPLEDLAYLVTAWTEPFGGLANYVRATAYSARVPAKFWQRIHKRDDDYFDVLAGYSAIDAVTGQREDILDGLGGTEALKPEELEALARAREATHARLRLLLGALAEDWAQFGDYFYAYKHGGLTVHRPDVAWVADDVTEMTPSTPRRDPSLAVWHRGGKAMEGRAEFGLDPSEIVKTVSGTGRLAVDLWDAFVDSRSAIFESVQIDDEGKIVALRPTQLPWTVWLREANLDAETWKIVGRGPRLKWIAPSDGAAPLSAPGEEAELRST